MTDTSSYKTFYQNPFYDEVFAFLLEKPVPPKQRKGKLQSRIFETSMRDRLKEMAKKDWPYTGNVMIVLSVTGSMDYLNNVDIDNVSKAILDVCKEILITDDRQVFSLIAEKHIQPETPSFMVALKKLEPGEFALFVPPFFGENPETWKEERKRKWGDHIK